MKIRQLELQRFTSFEEAKFEFSPTVNVFIGENGTGKSHLLKLLYSINEGVRRRRQQTAVLTPSAKPAGLGDYVSEMLMGVFQPEKIGRLVKRVHGQSKAAVHCAWDNGAHIELGITKKHRFSAEAAPKTFDADFADLQKSIFLPTREVLSIYPGFASAWLERESAFDRTYYELCVALGDSPLRGPRAAIRSALLEPLEKALGAKVLTEGGRFYLDYADGKMEAPLVAEGHRKLAMLAYLVLNGSLTTKGFLFWDEPEASMNPTLALLASDTIIRLSELGVQIFIATHDYSLTSEISLIAEKRNIDVRFFGLRRESGGVVVATASTATGLAYNPILASLADLHDREQASLDL